MEGISAGRYKAMSAADWCAEGATVPILSQRRLTHLIKDHVSLARCFWGPIGGPYVRFSKWLFGLPHLLRASWEG